ncbi:uncharacterized protein LOC143286547 [Babylonia areolata]|uniref:uncharacterized protein LOC143286547 n=1 Tax=Babylonia areolata TaxID=304850 RepID=UPI003FCFF3FB
MARESSCLSRVVRMIRCVTVEPVFFLFMFASSLAFSAFMAMTYDKSCLTLYNQTMCEELYNSKAVARQNQELTDAVQHLASAWIMRGNIAVTLPATVMLLLCLGSWGDRVGRRLPLMVPCVTAMADSVSNILNAVFMQGHLAFTLIGPVCSGLGGSYLAVLMAGFTYLTHLSKAGSRMMRVGVAESAVFLSSTLSVFVSGVLVDQLGYVPTFSIALGCQCLALLYVVLFLPEIKPLGTTSGSTGTPTTTSTTATTTTSTTTATTRTATATSVINPAFDPPTTTPTLPTTISTIFHTSTTPTTITTTNTPTSDTSDSTYIASTTKPSDSTPITPTTDPSNSTINPTTEASDSTTINPTTEASDSTTIVPTTDPTKSTTIASITDPTSSTIVNPTTDPSNSTTINPTTDPSNSTTVNPTTDPSNSTTINPTTDPSTTTTPSPPTTHSTTIHTTTTATTTYNNYNNNNNTPTNTPTADCTTTAPTTNSPTVTPVSLTTSDGINSPTTTTSNATTPTVNPSTPNSSTTTTSVSTCTKPTTTTTNPNTLITIPTTNTASTTTPTSTATVDSKACCHGTCLRSLRDMWRFVTTPRDTRVKVHLTLFILVMDTLELCTRGTMGIRLLYLKRSPRNWSYTTYGYFQGSGSFVRGAAVLLLLPLLKKMASPRDTTLILAGLVSKVAGLVLLGLATETWTIFLVVGVAGLQGFPPAGLRSTLASLVPKDEQGRLFGLVAATQGVVSLVSTLIFNGIYPETLSLYDGLCFQLAAFLVFICFVIVMFQHAELKAQDQNKNKETIPDATPTELPQCAQKPSDEGLSGLPCLGERRLSIAAEGTS